MLMLNTISPVNLCTHWFRNIHKSRGCDLGVCITNSGRGTLPLTTRFWAVDWRNCWVNSVLCLQLLHAIQHNYCLPLPPLLSCHKSTKCCLTSRCSDSVGAPTSMRQLTVDEDKVSCTSNFKVQVLQCDITTTYSELKTPCHMIV